MEKQPIQHCVVGFGREGISTCTFLLEKAENKPILVVDDQSFDELSPAAQQIIETNDAVTFQQIATLKETHFETVYKTPGIPLQRLTDDLGWQFKKLSSNTQLFFDEIEKLKKTTDTTIITIGITGTKGKSTTTAIIDHLLSELNHPHVTAGNMGIPPLDALQQLPGKANSTQSTEKPFLVVLELSSHQLAELHTSPNIAIIQNIFPEHLDYYDTFEEYAAAKAPVAIYQNENDIVITNGDSETATAIADRSPATTKINFGIHNDSDWKISPAARTINQANLSASPLVGEHNLYNMAPAVILGDHFGYETNQVAAVVSSFSGLPHRLETVATLNGVTYVNDSQATNPEAAIAAIKSFAGHPLVVIAGGYDKQLDMTPYARTLAATDVDVQQLILFPPVGEKILTGLQDLQTEKATQLAENAVYPVEKMGAAVAHALRAAAAILQNQKQNQKNTPTKNPIVLMSPACASFGLFSSYVDRGNQFKDAVHEM